jgi:rod shape determining protein RodA
MMLALLYVSRLSERFFIAVFGLVLVAVSILTVDLVGYSRFLEAEGLSSLDARGQYEGQSLLPIRDYQQERIMTFIAPEVVDPRGTGSAWNANQAQQAVGTGGLTGKGWQSGLQARLGYLPRSVAHNDFIFAVLAEEKGFIGGVPVIGLFALLLANGVRIAGIARDRFGMLLSIGVTSIFLIHIFINIGMTIGLTPITGLPLPFLSYGGSFLLSCCILQGIVQSVHRHRRAFL